MHKFDERSYFGQLLGVLSILPNHPFNRGIVWIDEEQVSCSLDDFICSNSSWRWPKWYTTAAVFESLFSKHLLKLQSSRTFSRCEFSHFLFLLTDLASPNEFFGWVSSGSNCTLDELTLVPKFPAPIRGGKCPSISFSWSLGSFAVTIRNHAQLIQTTEWWNCSFRLERMVL